MVKYFVVFRLYKHVSNLSKYYYCFIAYKLETICVKYHRLLCLLLEYLIVTFLSCLVYLSRKQLISKSGFDGIIFFFIVRKCLKWSKHFVTREFICIHKPSVLISTGQKILNSSMMHFVCMYHRNWKDRNNWARHKHIIDWKPQIIIEDIKTRLQ